LATGCDNIAAWKIDQSYPTGRNFEAAAPGNEYRPKVPLQNTYFFRQPNQYAEKEIYCGIQPVFYNNGAPPIPTREAFEEFNIFFFGGFWRLSEYGADGQFEPTTSYPAWALYPGTQLISRK